MRERDGNRQHRDGWASPLSWGYRSWGYRSWGYRWGVSLGVALAVLGGSWRVPSRAIAPAPGPTVTTSTQIAGSTAGSTSELIAESIAGSTAAPLAESSPKTATQSAIAPHSSSNQATSKQQSLVNSRWQLSYYDEAVDEARSYEIQLTASGRMIVGDPNDQTMGNDTWEQSGSTVKFCFNDCYAEYEGRLTPGGDRLTGTARNVADYTWQWRATRLN